MRYRNECLEEQRAILIGIIIVLLIALMITICSLVGKNSYDKGYQACVEEYNLYLPMDY